MVDVDDSITAEKYHALRTTKNWSSWAAGLTLKDGAGPLAEVDGARRRAASVPVRRAADGLPELAQSFLAHACKPDAAIGRASSRVGVVRFPGADV